MSSSMVISFLVFTLYVVHQTSGEKCASQDEDCSCTFKNKTGIYLRDISYENLKIRLNTTSGTSTYYYSPCKSFTLGKCKDVRACVNYTGPLSEDEQIPFIFNKNTTWTDSSHITYDSKGMVFNVTLVCNNASSPAKSMLTVGSVENKVVNLKLESKCACVGGCSSASGTQATIILFLLVTALTLWTY